MIEKIVTGVDGSETATEGAQKSAWLAHALGAELHVICAFGAMEDRSIKTEGENFLVPIKDEAADIAAETAARLKDEFPGLNVIASAESGKPAKALVKYAEEIDADLIVVGNKRLQGLSRILGSIAADVAHQAHCDVFVAHTHGHS